MTGCIPEGLRDIEANDLGDLNLPYCTPPRAHYGSDRAALVALYNATEGGSWTARTNWLSDRPLDEWHGVTTDSGGRVTALDLSSNHLVGALPAALGDLTNLRALNLWLQPVDGRGFRPELGGLSNLRTLKLGGNARQPG